MKGVVSKGRVLLISPKGMAVYNALDNTRKDLNLSLDLPRVIGDVVYSWPFLVSLTRETLELWVYDLERERLVVSPPLPLGYFMKASWSCFVNGNGLYVTAFVHPIYQVVRKKILTDPTFYVPSFGNDEDAGEVLVDCVLPISDKARFISGYFDVKTKSLDVKVSTISPFNIETVYKSRFVPSTLWRDRLYFLIGNKDIKSWVVLEKDLKSDQCRLLTFNRPSSLDIKVEEFYGKMHEDWTNVENWSEAFFNDFFVLYNKVLRKTLLFNLKSGGITYLPYRKFGYSIATFSKGSLTFKIKSADLYEYKQSAECHSLSVKFQPLEVTSVNVA